MLPLAKITYDPNARKPEKRVDQEIAAGGKRAPDLRPTPLGNAGREDGIGETRSRYGKDFQHPPPQWVVPEIDSALKDKS